MARRACFRADRSLSRHQLRELARLGGPDETPEEEYAREEFDMHQEKLDLADMRLFDDYHFDWDDHTEYYFPDSLSVPDLSRRKRPKRKKRQRSKTSVRLKRLEQDIRSSSLSADTKRQLIRQARRDARWEKIRAQKERHMAFLRRIGVKQVILPESGPTTLSRSDAA
jgi:hypothetical protein